MHPPEEATRLAREKLQRAEEALAAYEGRSGFSGEGLSELTRAVVAARRELGKLQPSPKPDGNEGTRQAS